MKRMMLGDLDWLMNYNQVKKRLFIRLLPKVTESSYVANIPLKEMAPKLFAAAYIILSDDDSRIATTMVNNDLLKKYRISKEELFRDAMLSSINLYPENIESMASVLGPLSLTSEDSDPKIIVVSNKNMHMGASAMFYPGVMEKVSLMFGGDFIMIPSSIHETLAIPADVGTRGTLRSIVKSVNASVVDPSDQLSDNVYIYNSFERKMVLL